MIKEWIAALRSGKYTQGYGRLDDGVSCCAFGVACRLMSDKLEINPLTGAYDGHVITPPDTVWKALGLTVATVARIMSMNDNEQRSFQEIADYLETLA